MLEDDWKTCVKTGMKTNMNAHAETGVKTCGKPCAGRVCIGIFKVLAAALLGVFFLPMKLNAGTIFNSPYVTFSPDQKAFTTNAGDRSGIHYEYGTVLKTGAAPTYGSLQNGQHYYKVRRTRNIPVGYWRVEFKNGHCYHDYYPSGYYHGILFGRSKCLRDYYSGWIAYCADCGEKIVNTYVYMSMDAAKSLSMLDMGYTYYYLCPFCSNLEMGADMGAHTCRGISWNRYQVRYVSNGEGPVEGNMPNSTHMYNNAQEYEGSAVAAQKYLTANAYKRKGYRFLGWNTRADGSGQSFADQQEILNLTQENYDGGAGGVVILYAQWEKNINILRIDPAGGTYQGRGGVTEIAGSYGETCLLDPGSLVPPGGKTVSFDSRGGSDTPPVSGTLSFAQWILVAPFAGTFSTNVYSYSGEWGKTDVIRASYRENPIRLPSVVKEDCIMKGWYYDPECTVFAGNPGDLLTPDRDLVLYAGWEDILKLTARVERILEPHEPVFRGGESGTLFFRVSGFPDRVVVSFPEILAGQFSSAETDFRYAGDQLIHEEALSFMVPLYTPLGEYPITVTAYRGSEVLSQVPVFWTLGEEESVLQEIRTRLR